MYEAIKSGLSCPASKAEYGHNFYAYSLKHHLSDYPWYNQKNASVFCSNIYNYNDLQNTQRIKLKMAGLIGLVWENNNYSLNYV